MWTSLGGSWVTGHCGKGQWPHGALRVGVHDADLRVTMMIQKSTLEWELFLVQVMILFTDSLVKRALLE